MLIVPLLNLLWIFGGFVQYDGCNKHLRAELLSDGQPWGGKKKKIILNEGLSSILFQWFLM